MAQNVFQIDEWDPVLLVRKGWWEVTWGHIHTGNGDLHLFQGHQYSRIGLSNIFKVYFWPHDSVNHQIIGIVYELDLHSMSRQVEMRLSTVRWQLVSLRLLKAICFVTTSYVWCEKRLPQLEDKKGKECPSSHTEWWSPDVSYQENVWDKRLWAHIPRRRERKQ